MIEKKDVIKLRLPYPDSDSKLAQKSHMYICIDKDESGYILAKVQTDRPSARSSMTHYVEEVADLSRNPFGHDSLIDCDKFFRLSDCTIADDLKTDRRPDVCDDLYRQVLENNPDHRIEEIDLEELKKINSKIT